MGLPYQRLRHFDLAIGAHEKAVKVKPDYVEAWFRLGALYALKGDREKVIGIYQKLQALTVIARKPTSSSGCSFSRKARRQELCLSRELL